MLYNSTRGGSTDQTFEQVVMRGLAPDGGLYVPQTVPSVGHDTINEWSKLSFWELAAEVWFSFCATRG